MKKNYAGFSGRFAVRCLTVALSLMTAGFARADLLYSFTSAQSNFSGSVQFTVSSVITTTTTISTFSSDTFSGLNNITVAPVAGQSCFGDVTNVPGPCIAADFTGIGVIFYFGSSLTSTGSYNTNGNNPGTLVISEASAAVPEQPSTLLLLLTAIVLLFGTRFRLADHRHGES